MSEITQRVPPNSQEAEKAVLGCMLKRKEAFAAVLERLNADDFYMPAHRHVFNAMVSLVSENKPVDEVTVVEYLANRGVLKDSGGIAYVTALSREVPVVTNLPYYVKLVEDKSTLRKLIAACEDTISDIYKSEQDVASILSGAEKRIFDISLKNTAGGLVQIGEAVAKSYMHISERSVEGVLPGLSTGLIDLDKMLNGLHKSDLIVIAGRPGMGKTAFALNIAQAAAIKENAVVAIFSLEMAIDQLTTRLLCSLAQVDMEKAKTGQNITPTEWDNLLASMTKLASSSIYVDDTAGISLVQMRSRLRRLKMETRRLDMVVIDYLQLLTYKGKADNRQQEVSEMTRNLKIMARDLDVPILLLSQLSRKSEERADKKPMLSDLRESGSIEQDADIVLMLYRPSQYEEEADNTAVISVAKHRNGRTGEVKVLWRGELTKFENLYVQ